MHQRAYRSGAAIRQGFRRENQGSMASGFCADCANKEHQNMDRCENISLGMTGFWKRTEERAKTKVDFLCVLLCRDVWASWSLGLSNKSTGMHNGI